MMPISKILPTIGLFMKLLAVIVALRCLKIRRSQVFEDIYYGVLEAIMIRKRGYRLIGSYKADKD